MLAINSWRQTLEFGKNKIKSELCKIQENTIETLEKIIEKSRKTHDNLRNRVDKLEYQLYEQRNNHPSLFQNNEVIQIDSKKEGKISNLWEVAKMKNANSSLSIGMGGSSS